MQRSPSSMYPQISNCSPDIVQFFRFWKHRWSQGSSLNLIAILPEFIPGLKGLPSCMEALHPHPHHPSAGDPRGILSHLCVCARLLYFVLECLCASIIMWNRWMLVEFLHEQVCMLETESRQKDELLPSYQPNTLSHAVGIEMWFSLTWWQARLCAEGEK